MATGVAGRRMRGTVASSDMVRPMVFISSRKRG
jgi:hypothetical protein